MGTGGESAAQGASLDASSANASAQERPAEAAAASSSEPVADNGAKEGGALAEGTDANAGLNVAAINAGESGVGGNSAAAESVKTQDTVDGSVDVPGKKATVKEQVIPQTLGGMLPMTLGVDGEGEFDFDKAVVRPEVKALLDKLAEKLKDSDYDTLTIVGHADRLGTEEYNQSLSERRAWAVARYLMTQGVPLQKIRVEGRGLHEPLSTPEECAGMSRKEAIVCLQKDRRVEIAASVRKTDVKVQ
jgi:outer membrane protein OmpA-like peptidoglycan-associated protein